MVDLFVILFAIVSILVVVLDEVPFWGLCKVVALWSVIAITHGL